MTCFAPDCLSVCLLMASDGATLPSRHLDLHSPVFDWVVFPFAAQLKDEPVVPPFGRAEPKVARSLRHARPVVASNSMRGIRRRPPAVPNARCTRRLSVHSARCRRSIRAQLALQRTPSRMLKNSVARPFMAKRNCKNPGYSLGASPARRPEKRFPQPAKFRTSALDTHRLWGLGA
jgi:hypothetical protein